MRDFSKSLKTQAGDMAWLGSSGGCAVYYFITSWLVGLSNYLVVCLVCMILVREKKHLLELEEITSCPPR